MREKALHGALHARSTVDEAVDGRPVTVPPMPAIQHTRVGKSLRPGRPGTIKLVRQFGCQLLLVRYRFDWTGLFRYTTVEVLVEASAVTRGSRPQALFAVHLKSNEPKLKSAVQRLGARWDPQYLCWLVPGHAVQALGLVHRVEWTESRHRRKRDLSMGKPST